MNKKLFFYLTGTILLVIPIILPLFHKGFFVTDDGEWMIIRLSAFYAAIRDGQFPVRFLGRLNNEYGYPVATFLYPGYMYIGSIIHLLKIGFVDTLKIILGVSMISSMAFSYFWLKKFFDKTSAILGSLFYVYMPYHLFDLYKRGSAGEILAFAIAPFIFWQIERKSLFWSAIGIGLLIISHNTLALFFVILIFLYMLLKIYVSDNKRSLMYQYTRSLILGVGLSSFFSIPAIFETKNTVFSTITVSNWEEYFAQVDLIGYSTFVVLLMTVLIFILKKASVKKNSLTVLMLITGVISIVFATRISHPFWAVIPVGFVQFPFRFLSITVICISFLASFVTSILKGSYRKLFVIISVLFLLIPAYKYIYTVRYFDKGDSFYSTNNDTTTVHDEYMPTWVKQKPSQRVEKKIEILKGKGSIESVLFNSKQISFITDLRNNSIIQVNTIYWPGWIAFVDKKQVPISYDNPKGVIRLNVPSGSHLVKLKFSETQLRLASDALSLASLIIILFVCTKRRYEYF